MKKLVLLVSFAMIFGVLAVNAQVPVTPAKKEAPKKEVVAAKKDAPKKEAAPAKKVKKAPAKKVATTPAKKEVKKDAAVK